MKLVDRGIGISLIQSVSRTHPASYPRGTGTLSLAVKRPGMRPTTYIQPVPRSRKCGSIQPLPHTPSWRSAYLVNNGNLKRKKVWQIIHFHPAVVVENFNEDTGLWTARVQSVQWLGTVCSTGVTSVRWARDFFVTTFRLDLGNIRPIQWLPGLFPRKSEGINMRDIPVTGRGGPYGCERLRLPHYLDKRLINGGKVC
jgi:hypothetical protein